ncbi:hypothetical protein [Piscinibacter sakaiensis]|uniref:hypothetical protein n=1 Tax=Piscinibacter sakaiensis TaxID=1547922 RepID=UPI003AAD21D5
MTELVFHRAEVLSHDAQKYSSTEIFGGGAYAFAVNGVVTAGTRDIQSQSTTHEHQALWVRDLDTGQEINLQLSDVGFRARPGHILTLAADARDGTWERLANESTGESNDRAGKFSRTAAEPMLQKQHQGWAAGVLLLIPLLNWIAGIFALVYTLNHPLSYAGLKVPGVATRTFKEIGAGVAAFVGPYASIVFSQEGLPFFAFLSLVVAVWGAFLYGKYWKEAYAAAAKVCLDRAALFDAKFAAFRKTLPPMQQRAGAASDRGGAAPMELGA